jgi:hypothetical protein
MITARAAWIYAIDDEEAIIYWPYSTEDEDEDEEDDAEQVEINKKEREEIADQI